ncbi:MAG: 7-carboxy-7-deazaguanine synthase QueE [Bacteroidia bacterium]|nr:7-carboxy-7-deazaguanine synthase QueE [Bacteroidia bacterium]
MGRELPLMESFYTIQGEGYHQGKAAYFIRLGGCDVGCVWCDVKDSWNADDHPKVSIEEIAAKAEQQSSLIAVITGGEPLMYDLDGLCDELHQKGIKTHIETSGAYQLTGKWDWVCLSPKKFKAPLPAILPLAHELKVIVYNNSDFGWAEKHAAQVNSKCKLYLQPEWDSSEKVMPLIAEYVKQHPQWQISLQIHKYMNIP